MEFLQIKHIFSRISNHLLSKRALIWSETYSPPELGVSRHWTWNCGLHRWRLTQILLHKRHQWDPEIVNIAGRVHASSCEQTVSDLSIENSTDGRNFQMVIKSTGILSTSMNNLSNWVALEYLRNSGLLDVTHGDHIEKVTGIVEHHLQSELAYLNQSNSPIATEVNPFTIYGYFRTILLAHFSHTLAVNTRTRAFCLLLRTDEDYSMRVYLSRQRSEVWSTW